MKIELHEITVREVSKDYKDNAEEGVVGYGGKLDIRPPYQREFVYSDKKREAVIDTIRKNFPLNVMYWVKNEDGTFGILDGQQRTVSFCQYISGDFSVDYQYFHNLTKPEQDRILDYQLMIYFCEGDEKEKLDWFRIINIAGEKLTEQELRNIVYTGPWLSNAKSIFSKSNCAAYQLSNEYVNGSPIRQEILETALNWISNGEIQQYMSEHQHDPNANELWTYYRNVINWVSLTFKNYRRQMKGVHWGGLYDQFHSAVLDTDKLENEIASLMRDDDVTNKKGIFPYVLSRNEKFLNIRAFTDNMKTEAYERQKGICPVCKKQFKIQAMEGDHIVPWNRGGKTSAENCQMLCMLDNRTKGGW